MVLRVDFYLLPTTTAPDSVKYACRLAEKSYLSKQKTLIWTASQADAEAINISLWTFRDISFVPHELYSVSKGSKRPAVLIAFEDSPTSGDVLINLTSKVPTFFNDFARIIEIVPDSEESLANSRKKYRIYQENNAELFSHDLKTPA